MSGFSTSWKDILIGVLIGYVVIDIMMSYMVRRSMPSCFEKMVAASKSQNGMMAIFIGILVGLSAWYLISQNTEGFEFEKDEKEDIEKQTIIN